MWWAAHVIALLLIMPRGADAALTAIASPFNATASSKTWTIRASGSGSSELHQALSIETAGAVFISYGTDCANDGDSDNTRAIVRVSGDDRTAIDELTVTITSQSHDGGGGNEDRVHVRALSDELVVEVVFTQPNQLHTLSVSGRGDVVVGDQVFAASGGVQSDLMVDVSGFGSVFVTTAEPLKALKASLTVSSSGGLQVEAPEFHFESLEATNFALSADIKLLSNSQSSANSSPNTDSSISSASFTVASSGGVCWDAPSLHVEELDVLITGSGTVWATDNGSCDTETLTISGPGNVRLGNLACQHAQVSIVGSGDALVQASQYLGGFVRGSGSVKYTGQQPLVMSDKNGQLGASNLKAIAKPAIPTPGLKCNRNHVPTLTTHKCSSNRAPGLPSNDYPGGPRQHATHSVDYQSPRPSDRDTTSSTPSDVWYQQLWESIKTNSIVAIPVGVFIAFWIVILTRSRRDRWQHQQWRRNRNPEQQFLLGHDQDETEDRPVYV